MGHGIRVHVKHENHLPTNSFKYLNGLSALTALSAGDRAKGVIATTLGNHGQGVALGTQLLGIDATIVVPLGNNRTGRVLVHSFTNPDVVAGAGTLTLEILDSCRRWTPWCCRWAADRTRSAPSRWRRR